MPVATHGESSRGETVCLVDIGGKYGKTYHLVSGGYSICAGS